MPHGEKSMAYKPISGSYGTPLIVVKATYNNSTYTLVMVYIPYNGRSYHSIVHRPIIISSRTTINSVLYEPLIGL